MVRTCNFDPCRRDRSRGFLPQPVTVRKSLVIKGLDEVVLKAVPKVPVDLTWTSLQSSGGSVNFS